MLDVASVPLAKREAHGATAGSTYTSRELRMHTVATETENIQRIRTGETSKGHRNNRWHRSPWLTEVSVV